MKEETYKFLSSMSGTFNALTLFSGTSLIVVPTFLSEYNYLLGSVLMVYALLEFYIHSKIFGKFTYKEIAEKEKEDGD